MEMRYGTWNVSRFYSNKIEGVYWIDLSQEWRALFLLVLRVS